MRITLNVSDTVLPNLTANVDEADGMMDFLLDERKAIHTRRVAHGLRGILEHAARYYDVDWTDIVDRPTVRDDYPHPSGDVTVLGPGVILDGELGVINYKGENYYLTEEARQLLEHYSEKTP